MQYAVYCPGNAVYCPGKGWLKRNVNSHTREWVIELTDGASTWTSVGAAKNAARQSAGYKKKLTVEIVPLQFSPVWSKRESYTANPLS